MLYLDSGYPKFFSRCCAIKTMLPVYHYFYFLCLFKLGNYDISFFISIFYSFQFLIDFLDYLNCWNNKLRCRKVKLSK